MFKRKFMMGGIATLAMLVVVGSGFAVWNFETSDDASKGIYNLGLYVTPNVETVGTVSTNNDYALILDQGALPELKMVDGENSSSVRESLADNADYYKRGIYVGKLKKDERGEWQTLPNGAIDYDQISTVNGFWIQEISDAQAVVAENINQMEFTTKIKIRKDLARFVQVRNDDNTNSKAYKVADDLELIDKEEYVTYTYNWGSLNDVLTQNGENYRITKTYHDLWELASLEQYDNDGGEALKTAMFNAYNKLNEPDLSNKEELKDEDAPAVDVLQDALRNQSYSGKVKEDDCYNSVKPNFSDGKTIGGGLTLRGHQAIKAYVVYEKETNSLRYYSGAAPQLKPDEALSIVYFMHFNKNVSGEYLKTQDSFLNDFNNEAQYTEITSYNLKLLENKEAGSNEPKYNEFKDETGNVTQKTLTFTDDSSDVDGIVKTFEIVNCYYFEYKLDTSNYGADGNENMDHTMQYENIKFIYYPCTKGEEANWEEKGGIFNTSSKIQYIRKPATGDEYDDMITNSVEDGGLGIAQNPGDPAVSLDTKYVIVEFSSQLTVAASDIGA